MAETETPTERTSKQTPTFEATPGATTRVEPLVIRAWPKIVLMLPAFFMALICGVAMTFYELAAAEGQFSGIHVWGLLFLLVLAVNLTMVLYDLNLRGFLIVVLLIVALVLGLFLLNREGEVWQTIGEGLSVRAFANSAFYFIFALVLLFNLFIAWVITRFNYWKVEHNEIIIHRGFMQEQERHPTAQARFKLVIEDIVEYGILGCGKLVFYFGDDDTEHVLPTVLFVHKKAKRLDDLLGRVAVVTRG